MPHEPLAITELADRLGVSGTPIREALTRLHAEGLLIWEPGKGFSAKSLSLAELRNLHDLAFLLLRHAVERSEEHTSELQSLMSISYAVSCLKNKKQHITQHEH